MTRTPMGLLVMEERRRHEVYPGRVMAQLSSMVTWAGPAVTRDQGLVPGRLDQVAKQ